MCYNCGCGESNNDHKDATNNMEWDDAKQNTVNLMKKKAEAV
jgi:hypothetical protein